MRRIDCLNKRKAWFGGKGFPLRNVITVGWSKIARMNYNQ